MPIVNLNSSRVVNAMVLKVGFLQLPAVSKSSVYKDRPSVRFFLASASDLLVSSESSLSSVTTAV